MVVHTKTLKDYINYYDFYATPDGQECLPKTYYYTKYGALGGAIFSIYEMALISKPQTLHSTLARFGRFTFPFAGMGFAFGASLCLLGQIRKKDDFVNHLIGGAIAGSVWGMKFRKVSTGHAIAVVTGLTAGYYKYFKENNLPTFTSRTDAITEFDPRLDFTIKLYDDPGRPNEA
ncbi:uncharacterized protein TNIN_486911 [Trichonephila inaurata madagascariensis]|uniref:NADH dehydrogenase [ubiquinone] 1 alpha subcomplex subunit 11 n=1 Tax=Trichonephila inaurata madagascariensis TaxID=2747483 RepID=A0A8X6WPC7_9ARAC|nr:uncharacterized protein TNIN_486911 [Trichonephila inaurata madagascariensis]